MPSEPFSELVPEGSSGPERARFLAKIGADEEGVGEYILALFERAHHAADGELVEAAIVVGSVFTFPPGSIEWVHRLARETWHHKHADLLALLQVWRAPSSVPIVRGLALLKPGLTYLDYDDYGAFYKKCCWALTAIGTAQAGAVLEEFATSDEPELREQAVQRLAKFAGGAA